MYTFAASTRTSRPGMESQANSIHEQKPTLICTFLPKIEGVYSETAHLQSGKIGTKVLIGHPELAIITEGQLKSSLLAVRDQPPLSRPVRFTQSKVQTISTLHITVSLGSLQ